MFKKVKSFMFNKVYGKISAIAGAAVAFGICVTPAIAGSLDTFSAAPVSTPPPAINIADWKGPYAGLSGSYSEHSIDHNYDDTVSFGYSANGLSGGIVAGYNFQTGNIVYGLEASHSLGSETGSGLCDGGTVPTCGGTGSLPTITFDHVTSLKGRVGFANGDFLHYGTVGLSKAEVTVSDTLQPATVSRTHDGYSVGLGTEWMATDRLSVDLGYEFMQFEGIGYPLVTTPDTIEFQSSRISASVKFHF